MEWCCGIRKLLEFQTREMNHALRKNTVVSNGKRSGIKEKDERKEKRLCADATKA